MYSFQKLMNDKKIYFFMGTTAEFIKLSPIIKELKSRKKPFKIITSGQNKIHFEDLKGYVGDIKTDISLPSKANKFSIFLFGIWALKTLVYCLFTLRREFKGLNKDNSYLFIHGDTVSSLLGCLIGFYYGLKIVHVESGLRSFNFLEPFPEEICRYINIHLADILFAPTNWAFNNLKGLKGEKINTHENTLIETFSWAIKQKCVSPLKDIGKYYILIMHRQEHMYFQKEWTKKILELIIESSAENLNCIFLMNPLTIGFLEQIKLQNKINKKVIISSHMSYSDFMNLMKNAEFIATDGCTNQEEAFYLGLPMLALRNLTERIEGLNANVVISKDDQFLIKKFLNHYKSYRKSIHLTKNRPSKIIVDYLEINNKSVQSKMV